MTNWEAFLQIEGWKSNFRSVDRLLRHYKRKVGSEHTKANACQTVKALSEFVDMMPDRLVKLSPREASSFVQDFVDSLAQDDYSIRYVNVCLAYLKTFFKVNGFKGNKALEVERHYQPSRYRKREEYIPTSEEIYKMAYASGSARNKVLILALYTSGLRNSTLRALLYKDVKDELEKGLDILKVPVYAGMKEVVTGACKGNIPYYSFLSMETVEALREYHTQRMVTLGGISYDEPLFAATSKNLEPELRRKTPVMKKTLEHLVKRAARNAGVKKWKAVSPHCLRKAFESALRNNGLDIKDQEFLMGHILPGSQDTYYDKTKIEDLRNKYAKVNFFPRRAYSSEEFRKKQVLDTVKLMGFPEDRIRRVEEALAKYATIDDAMEEIRKLSLRSYQGRSKKPNDPKKIIDEHDLENYLTRGWDIQTILPSGKILIKNDLQN